LGVLLFFYVNSFISLKYNRFNMEIQLLDVILIVLFFELLTIVPFLLFQKTKRGVSNKILGLLLIAKALCITNFISFRFRIYTLELFPHLFYFGSSFTILWGPLLFLYVKSLSINSFRISKKDIFHFIPFFAHLLWLSFSFHINSAEMKRTIIENGGIYTLQAKIIYRCLLYTYILIYSSATLVLIKNYNLNQRNNFSSLSKINLNWMSFIVIGFIIKVGFDIWYVLAEYGSTGSTIAIYLSRIILFLFINIIIYKGLKEPLIWHGETSILNNKKQPLSKTLQDKYLEKLLSYTREYKPYLNPEITLEKLATFVDIPPRSLSWILNDCLKQSFYDFINYYRIKESKKIFKDFSSNHKTVLEVLYEVGFNSKSSFNTAFKKYNKITPTEYRKLKSLQLN